MALNHFMVLIILGIIQGIAEFIPVSSSGHLVLVSQIECFKASIEKVGPEGLLMINVALHVATLVVVLIYLRRDVVLLFSGFIAGIIRGKFNNKEVQTGFWILIASIPAGLIGFIFNDTVERLFSSGLFVFILLIINGIILISTKIIPVKDRSLDKVGFVRSLVVGFCQAVAIMPGISRSGMTITGGMLMGLAPQDSARFSFLMAIPVILGAGLHEGIKAVHHRFPVEMVPALAVSMLITMLVGLVSLKVLFAMVRRIRIHIFGYYTIALGLAGVIATFLMR